MGRYIQGGVTFKGVLLSRGRYYSVHVSGMFECVFMHACILCVCMLVCITCKDWFFITVHYNTLQCLASRDGYSISV